MADAILKIGTFGTHITKNPAGTFSFVGAVPESCVGSFGDFETALASFITFFKAQSVTWQRENVGNLRNDVFTKLMES